ncbi:hypothetical protein GGI07_004549 [Coemansia sp. Benny D115]|nr:hypothetical protein GGI07_004549 [Coemansia sp. Benny D115]
MLQSAVGRFRTTAPKNLLIRTANLAAQHQRQNYSTELNSGNPEAAKQPVPLTPAPELNVRVYGALPQRDGKARAIDRHRTREHLRRLQPKLRAIGTQQTDLTTSKRMLDHTSSELTLETMMAAGMHLGHSASLWNPLNLPFIFGEREGIHIINLEHTMAALRRASHFIRQVAYHGGIILFVGARKEHRQMAVDAALHAEQYFVTGKWIPGTLTNPRPLLGKHIMYVEDVWDVEEAREFADYTPESPQTQTQTQTQTQSKSTRQQNQSAGQARYMDMIKKEKERLLAESDGLKTYKPDLIVALNPLECQTMLAESCLAHVPTIGIVDTNCDPRIVTYPIPCNDDSLRSVSIVAGVLARAAKAGVDVRRAKLTQAAAQHNAAALSQASAQAEPNSDELE